jgi:hypothetical protein
MFWFWTFWTVIKNRNSKLRLHLCPAKWQIQYKLMEKTTPVNTGALLWILEKIENKAEVETKPPNMIKPRGAVGKCRMDSIDSPP